MLPLTFFGLVGCSKNSADTIVSSTKKENTPQTLSQTKTVNLMENFVSSNTSSEDLDLLAQQAISSFAIDMFKESILTNSSENIMLSPISVVNALAMTSNGAVGDTLNEMETLLGGNRQEIATYLKNYNSILRASNNHINIANSIWFKDSVKLEVKDEFLQLNKDYFDADVYKSQFNDDTLTDINSWVSENTDGMIDSIIQEIPDNAIMYLINAVSFDAEWDEIYLETKVNEGEFFNADGTISKIEFMTSEESQVIVLEKGVGFIKPYKNDEYSFIGILPNDGVSIQELVEELTSKDLNSIVNGANFEDVDVVLPKFKVEYSTELSNLLANMGMVQAFESNNADFSDMATGDGNIYIGNVLHKTFINVDEKGTQAGAVTAVEMLMKMAMPMMKREIRLDSPFIYLIVDNRQNIPIFLGNINNIE